MCMLFFTVLSTFAIEQQCAADINVNIFFIQKTTTAKAGKEEEEKNRSSLSLIINGYIYTIQSLSLSLFVCRFLLHLFHSCRLYHHNVPITLHVALLCRSCVNIHTHTQTHLCLQHETDFDENLI